MRMWKGSRWRQREAMLPFAVQSYFTQAMFSKDITLKIIIDAFDAILGFTDEPE